MNPKSQTIKELIKEINRPTKAVITAGMPYANGEIHLGHLAGAHIPADIHARFMRMLIGKENVLFVSGSDEHGSTSEISAIKANKNIRNFIDEIHNKQADILKKYNISLDIYSGTSQSDCISIHTEHTQNMIRCLFKNDMLYKKVSKQWFDPNLNLFLQDRNVTGKCPKCENTNAYSEECDLCGSTYLAEELKEPKSSLSDSKVYLKETFHYYLNMEKVWDLMIKWTESKQKIWKKAVYNQVISTITPKIQFDNIFEDAFKTIKNSLPKHSSRYVAGKKIEVLFSTFSDLNNSLVILKNNSIPYTIINGWAHRAISRDSKWGIPFPEDLDSDMKGKTIYVWPESLIAPISFSHLALKKQNKENDLYQFWKDPCSKLYQFLGQDNVFFYAIMQSAMWLGSQEKTTNLPGKDDLILNEIYSACHLLVDGLKMSKSKGNFITGNDLISKGYSSDQIRYFLSILNLGEKSSNFEFKVLDERNSFLAGPMNAAFEKPISAVHAKFNGIVPNGSLIPKVEEDTTRLVKKYLYQMERGEYSTLLFLIENYARLINSLFVQYKPHDDRAELKGREDALFSCFYILKNLMIMLYPFVPDTMSNLNSSLNLTEKEISIDNLGTIIPAGHLIGSMKDFFKK